MSAAFEDVPEISPLASDPANSKLPPPAGSQTNNADQNSHETQVQHVGVVAPVLSSQGHHENQLHNAAEAQISPPATHSALPNSVPLAGIPNHPGDQRPSGPHAAPVSGVPNNSLPANASTTPSEHAPVENQTPPGNHSARATQNTAVARGPFLADPFLGVLASTVDDLENTRKATANRLRQLTRSKKDKDGHLRGLGMDESSPDVAVVKALLVAIGGEKIDRDGKSTYGSGGIEHQAVLRLEGRVRKHPLWKSWGVHQKGVGQKQFARLLAAIGDPYWNDLHERPRTISELWSYCGYSVVRPSGQNADETQALIAGGTAPKKQRGQKVNWSQEARMRTWNITGSCIKAQDYYADVYYDAREKYAESTHSVECVRCVPKGRPPAQIGSALNDGHKHARAIRIMCKEILRDLWVAAKELHEA